MSDKNNHKKSGYSIDPRFGKHDPRESPLGQATEVLLKKMYKQQQNTPEISVSSNKSNKKQ